MPPTLATGTLNPRLNLRDFTAGDVIDPGPQRATVSDDTLGCDCWPTGGAGGPLGVSRIDFLSPVQADNIGSQFMGAISGLTASACAFQGWDRGTTCEKASATTGLFDFRFSDCHWTDCGTIGLLLGDAHSGRLFRCIFDRCGWSPQGERTDPTQTHLLYLNDTNCSDILIDGCLFNNGRMNNTRCCGTMIRHSVSINGGCCILGGKITRSIAANVVTLTHDPAPGLPAGGVGIDSDSPHGCVYSGNLVAHPGTAATGNLRGMAAHGSYSDLAMTGNKVFDWAVVTAEGGRTGVGIYWGGIAGTNCQCTGNQVQMPNGGKCVEVTGDNLSSIVFRGNIYFSTDPKPFVVNGQEMTFDEWVAMTGDTSSRFVQIEYVDAGRTLDRFVTEFLGVTVTDAGAQFCAACRAYPELIQVFAGWMWDGFKTE